MKRIVAFILISLLVAPPASAGQQPPKAIAWEQAQQLEPGKEILVTLTGEQPAKVSFLFADNATLVTRKPTTSKLAGDVERALRVVGPKWPAVFEGYPVTVDRVQVSRDGIFEQGRKVADLGDVVQQTPRADVLSIAEPPSHGHGLRYFLIGLAAAITVMILLIGISTGWED